MYLDPKRNQFHFETLTDGSYAITFKPFSSKFCKRRHFVVIKPKNRYHSLAARVIANEYNWLEISFLADLCINSDGLIITSI